MDIKHQRPRHKQRNYPRHQPIIRTHKKQTSAQSRPSRSVGAAAVQTETRVEGGGGRDHSQRLQDLYPDLVRDRVRRRQQDLAEPICLKPASHHEY